ncbi:MAG: deoxyribodipyrimidine photo-lyase/cryptochrome family protein [Bacteroidota bacterium]
MLSQDQGVVVMWFKRDLRLHDNYALAAALTSGNLVLPIYIFESNIIRGDDQDERHHRFIWESIADINSRLASFNTKVLVLYGNAADVFTAIIERHKIVAVYSHQETGNQLTFQRDKKIAELLKLSNINWHESLQLPVFRKLKNRSEWGRRMNEFYADAQLIIDDHHWAKFIHDKELEKRFAVPDVMLERLSIPNKMMQPGGESYGWRYLESFLRERGLKYAKQISKPNLSRTSCSRLSPYIAYGCLSARMVIQYTRQEIIEHPTKKFPLNQFLTRLHWQAHFIQKFEQECEMEEGPVNKAYPDRDIIQNEDWINAWKTGTTGYPLVDACMRCVAKTGYLNFRMRAMVVSFFVHNLGQHWKTAALHLAKQFLDYEPGIHYPQIQMQAGITGTNTLRMYNVVKQSYDNDADGIFIKTWIPELAQLPKEHIHEPWKLTEDLCRTYNFIPGINYPLPIVNHEETMREARARLAEIRNSDEFRKEAGRILKKLTNPNRETIERRKKKQPKKANQTKLFATETRKPED